MSSKNNIVASVVVAVLVSVGAWIMLPQPATRTVEVQVPTVGSGVETNVTQYVNGVGIGNVVYFTKTLNIGARENGTLWRNTTGKTVYIDQATAFTAGTATSTKYRLFVLGSSASTVSDWSVPVTGILVDAVLGSSTAATTTNSIRGVGSTLSLGVVKVADGEYVHVKLLNAVANGSPLASCNGTSAPLCETATSSNRGITGITAVIKGFYQK